MPLFRQAKNTEYHPIGLSGGVRYTKINCENLGAYATEAFDFVICNHTIEHIHNLSLAISEMLRVLKPNGQFIVSFPVADTPNTIEGDFTDSPETRLKNFGQIDHVRLFGKDYKKFFPGCRQEPQQK